MIVRPFAPMIDESQQLYNKLNTQDQRLPGRRFWLESVPSIRAFTADHLLFLAVVSRLAVFSKEVLVVKMS
jgi:hypothetical protein